MRPKRRLQTGFLHEMERPARLLRRGRARAAGQEVVVALIEALRRPASCDKARTLSSTLCAAQLKVIIRNFLR